MTDEMTVQAQRPSAMPYVLGGAGVGAVAGGSLAKWGNVGIQGQAYSNWEEAVADANKDDKFIKEMAEKDGNDKTWKVLKDEIDNMASARETYNKAVPEQIRDEKVFTDYIEKAGKLTEATTAHEKKLEEAYDKAFKTINEMEIKDEHPFEWNGKQYKQAEFRQYINDPANKDEVKKLVTENSAYTDLVGEGEKSIIKAEKQALKDADDAAKVAKKALTEKVDDLNKNLTDKIDVNKVDNWVNEKKVFTEAAEKSKKNLTDEILNQCKKPKVWLTALAGAAALALVGAMIRPKGEQA